MKKLLVIALMLFANAAYADDFDIVCGKVTDYAKKTMNDHQNGATTEQLKKRYITADMGPSEQQIITGLIEFMADFPIQETPALKEKAVAHYGKWWTDRCQFTAAKGRLEEAQKQFNEAQKNLNEMKAAYATAEKNVEYQNPKPAPAPGKPLVLRKGTTS